MEKRRGADHIPAQIADITAVSEVWPRAFGKIKRNSGAFQIFFPKKLS